MHEALPALVLNSHALQPHAMVETEPGPGIQCFSQSLAKTLRSSIGAVPPSSRNSCRHKAECVPELAVACPCLYD